MTDRPFLLRMPRHGLFPVISFSVVAELSRGGEVLLLSTFLYIASKQLKKIMK